MSRSRPLLPRLRIFPLLAGMLVPGTAFAQLTSDQVPRERTVPAREVVEKEVEKSRFRLGMIRLTPTLEVSNAGYDDNVFGASEGEEKVADWSATVQGGVRWILPFGSKVFLRGRALPGYVWYRELTARRTVIGTYDGSFLALFNRMSIELTGSGSKSFVYLNSETETQIVQNESEGSAKIEVNMTPVISLFAGAQAQRLRFTEGGGDPVGEPDDVANLSEFGRTDAAARGGLRFRPSSWWDVSVAIDATQTEFDERSEERDNQSVAYLAGIHYDRPRFYINLIGGYRRGLAHNDSLFPEYSTGTGSYFASYFLTPKVELQAFGRRRVVYGRFLSNSYYFETRNGGAVSFRVRPRLLLRGHAETGPNDYLQPARVDGRAIERTDKVTTFGGGFSVHFFRNAVFAANVTRSNHSSNVPGQNRSVVRFTTRLSLEGDLTR